MRIIRTLVLLTAVAVFLPSPPEERADSAAMADPPATQFLTAAVSMVADMRDFCGRQAIVCDTAHYLAVKLEGKAKYGIELFYQWASEAPSDATAVASSEDGAGVTTMASEPARPSQNTLELEDLIPDWRPPARQG